MNETTKSIKENEEKLKNQCSNDEERYNIIFQQYKLLLEEFKNKMEIRLNRLDHNCYDTLVECKKLCKNLEDIVREEVRTRIDNENDLKNRLFILNEEVKNGQINDFVKMENRLNDISNSLHSYIESEILENKLFVNKYISEQLEMINQLNNRCDELFESENNIISDMQIIDKNTKSNSNNNIKLINEIKENQKEILILNECDKLVNQIIHDECIYYILLFIFIK